MSQGQQPASVIGQLTGQLIGGRYRLGDRLGQGGMGVVYTATQESLARPVALKVLQPMLAQDDEAILRFKAEAERAGRLAHPHIVQILDFGHEPGASAWIAMELLKGQSLAARIERGPLSEAEVVRIAKETLSALEAAHAAHLVHRDLKPDNIFLADVPGIGTSVKVLDFGIAKLLDDESAGKLTATGMLIGTPLYMAPEQARGSDVDQRADLYALGAVLYEALTGKPPFTGKNYNALLYSVLSETPVPIDSFRPDISPELARVVARAMEKTPEARWQSANAMAEALRTLHPSEHLPVMRTPTPSHAPLATAPTMATPVPAEPLGATTPAMGGAAHDGVAPLASVVARATPPTRTTPAPLAATPAPVASTPPPPQSGKSAQPFHWWPIALAGGVLASATFAVVGVGTVLRGGTDAAPSLAMAPSAQSRGDTPTSTLNEVPTPSTPTTVAMTPMAVIATPTPGPGLPLDPTPNADAGPVTGAQVTRPDPVHATPTHRVRGPRLFWSGGQFVGMTSSADIRGPIEAEGGWEACWPAGVPAPEVNRGRDFLIDIAPDGHVLSASPAPHHEEPAAFAACVVAKVRRLTFARTATGEVAHIRFGFSVRPPSPSLAR